VSRLQPSDPAPGGTRSSTLEAVKLAAELGVDLNAASTALDAAKDLRYSTVVKFLVEKGARAGRFSRKPNGNHRVPLARAALL